MITNGLRLAIQSRLAVSSEAGTGWFRPLMVLGIPLAALAYDLRIGDHRVLDGVLPRLTTGAVVQSLLIGAVAAVLAGMATAPAVDRGGAEETPGWRLARAGIPLLAVGFFLLLALDPQAFNRFGAEDALVETASAALALGVAGVFAVTALRLRRSPGHRWAPLGIAATFAGVFFLLGMEEISWGQRFLGFGSPEVFEANLQGEANLHNFATGEVEAIYYTGSFLFLVVLPLLFRSVPAFAGREVVERFVPSRRVMLVSTLVAAYTYDMWLTLTAQFGFFFSVFALGFLAYRTGASTYPLLLLAACVVIQGGFLAVGESQVRLWDVTEYKELLIPLCFLLYALEVMRRSDRHPGFPAAAGA
jgi:hypothetical protein